MTCETDPLISLIPDPYKPFRKHTNWLCGTIYNLYLLIGYQTRITKSIPSITIIYIYIYNHYMWTIYNVYIYIYGNHLNYVYIIFPYLEPFIYIILIERRTDLVATIKHHPTYRQNRLGGWPWSRRSSRNLCWSWQPEIPSPHRNLGRFHGHSWMISWWYAT